MVLGFLLLGEFGDSVGRGSPRRGFRKYLMHPASAMARVSSSC